MSKGYPLAREDNMKRLGIRFNDKEQIKKVKDLLKKVRKDERWKKEASEVVINNIKISTRLGKNIKDSSKQPALERSTIEKRRHLAKSNPKGISFKPEKSNLTMTGQLLNSLERKNDPERVVIGLSEERQPYLNKNGTKGKNPPSNEQIARYLKEQGREFLGFNEKLKKVVEKKLKEHLRRHLKDLNNK